MSCISLGPTSVAASRRKHMAGCCSRRRSTALMSSMSAWPCRGVGGSGTAPAWAPAAASCESSAVGVAAAAEGSGGNVVLPTAGFVLVLALATAGGVA